MGLRDLHKWCDDSNILQLIHTEFHADNSRARDSEEETDEDEELSLAGQKNKSKLSPVCYSLVHNHLQ